MKPNNIKNKDMVRSISLKIKSPPPEFEQHMLEYTKCVFLLTNEIITFKGGSIFVNDKLTLPKPYKNAIIKNTTSNFKNFHENEIDLDKCLEHYYDIYTNKSISFKRFKLICKIFFYGFVGFTKDKRTGNLKVHSTKGKSNIYAPEMFNKKQKFVVPDSSFFKYLEEEIEPLLNDGKYVEALEKYDAISEKNPEKNAYEKVGGLCRTCIQILHSMNYFDHFNFNNTIQLRGCIWNVHKQVSSWIDRNLDTKIQYEKEEANINAEFNKILDDNVEFLRNFFEYCVNNNFIKKFNYKIQSHFLDCVIPAIENNMLPTELFRLYKDKDGTIKKAKFSLNDNVYNFLLKHKKLCPLLKNHINMLQLIIEHNKHLNHSKFPLFEQFDENSIQRKRVKYKTGTGSNYINYDICGNGDKLQDKYDCSKSNLNDKKINYETKIEKIKSDPKLTDNKKSKSIKKYENKIKNVKEEFKLTDGVGNVQNFTLKIYLSPDNPPVEVLVYTVDVRLAKNGVKNVNPSRYFKNLSIYKTNLNNFQLTFEKFGKLITGIVCEPEIEFRNGEYFIVIPYTQTIKYNQDNWNFKEYHQYAYPTCKTPRAKLSDQKAKNILEKIKNKEFTLLSLDVGTKNHFGCAVIKTKIKDTINPITEIIHQDLSNNTNSPIVDKYFEFSDMMKIAEKFVKKYDNDKFDDKNTKILLKNIKQFANEYFKTYKNTVILKSNNSYKNFHKNVKLFEWFLKTPIENIITLYSNNTREELKDMNKWCGTIILKYINYLYKNIKRDRKFYINRYKNKSKQDGIFYWLYAIDTYQNILKSFYGNNRDPKNSKSEEFPNKTLKEVRKYYVNLRKDVHKQIVSEINQLLIKYNVNVIIMEDFTVTMSEFNEKGDNNFFKIWAVNEFKNALENVTSFHGIEIVEVNPNYTSQTHYQTKQIGWRYKDFLYYMENNEIKRVHADLNAPLMIADYALSRHTSLTKIKIDKNNNSIGKQNDGCLTYEFESIKNAVDTLSKLDETNTEFFRCGDKWLTKKEKTDYVQNIKSLAIKKYKLKVV